MGLKKLWNNTVNRQCIYIYIFIYIQNSKDTMNSAIIQFFSLTPKCPGSFPWGYAYHSFGITGLEEKF
jgi:hypothetical protein